MRCSEGCEGEMWNVQSRGVGCGRGKLKVRLRRNVSYRRLLVQ